MLDIVWSLPLCSELGDDSAFNAKSQGPMVPRMTWTLVEKGVGSSGSC